MNKVIREINDTHIKYLVFFIFGMVFGFIIIGINNELSVTYSNDEPCYLTVYTAYEGGAHGFGTEYDDCGNLKSLCERTLSYMDNPCDWKESEGWSECICYTSQKHLG